MKVQFITSKSNRNAVENELQPFIRAASLSLNIRDHKKNDQLIVIELENDHLSGIQPPFERYLKMRENQKMIRAIKVEGDSELFASK